MKKEIRNEEIQILETRSKLRVLRDRKEKSEKNQSERANQSILWQEAFNGYNLSDRDDKGNTQTQLTRPDLGPARQEGDEGEQGSTC